MGFITPSNELKTAVERLQARHDAYRAWIVELNDKEEQWLKDHGGEQKMLTPAPAYDKIPLVEVRESPEGSGFWEVLVDGRLVFGTGGADAHQRATKRAADVLKVTGFRNGLLPT